MFAYHQNNYQVAKLFFCQLQPFTQKYKDTIGFGEFHTQKMRKAVWLSAFFVYSQTQIFKF